MYKSFYIYIGRAICLLMISVCMGNLVQGQCVENGNRWAKSWVSCEESTNPNPDRPKSHWLLFDFLEPQNIDTSYIWNANRVGESNLGIKVAEVDYSVDGTTWQYLGTFNFPKANEQGDYEGFEGPDFKGLFLKKILITVVETHGDGSCASLAEIKFEINEEACYGDLDSCGVCNGPGKTLWYIDEDGDGLGSPNVVLEACGQPDGYVDNAEDYCDNGLVGWSEVSTIFSENGCTGCHGMAELGGLNLTSYETAIQGGDKCGPNILTGTTLANIIMVDNYAGCGTPIAFPRMNARTGGQIDSAEIATIQEWINAGAPLDCNCIEGSSDDDEDGVCDKIDACPNLDNSLIGTPCDDSLSCTINDVWTSECECAGTPLTDTDGDGVCDDNDVAPNNPCTADGIIDGKEPEGWIANPSNDCDGDFLTIAVGDLNDFEPCVDQNGSINTAECSCGDDLEQKGGTVVSGVGFGNVNRANGLPDGSLTSGMYGSGDSLIIQLPYMSKGEEVCIAVQYTDVNGQMRVDVNGNLFTLVNVGAANVIQEKCFQTLEEGVQILSITESGSGGIRIDGTQVNYCPCSDSSDVHAANLISSAYTSSSMSWQVLSEDEVVVCEGDSLRLSVGSDPNATYTWTGPNIGAISGLELDLGKVTTQTAGLYTAAYQDIYGCTVRKDIRVIVEEAPLVTMLTVNPTCLSPQGGAITFKFGNNTSHTNIEFSIDGESGPYQRTDDIVGSFSFANLTFGTYEVWTRWSADHCPTYLGQVKLESPCQGTEISVLLEGPYHADSMNAALVSFIPLQDPYLGTVNLTVIPPDMVDWVLVEVRSQSDPSQVLAQLPCLLRSDGVLVNSNGDSKLVLGTDLPARAFISVSHRNHLGIITASAVNLALPLDFGDPTTETMGINPRKLLDGKAFLWGGDANGDGVVNAIDLNLEWRPRNGAGFQYNQGGADLNMDGVINAVDQNILWRPNNGKNSQIP